MRSFYMLDNFLARNFQSLFRCVNGQIVPLYCCNLYGGYLLYSYKQCLHNKISIAYKKCSRSLSKLPRCCSPSILFVSISGLSFDELLRKFVNKIMCCPESSLNNSVKSSRLIILQNTSSLEISTLHCLMLSYDIYVQV